MRLSREDLRPALHAATGLVALGLGVYPRWFALAGAAFGILVGWVGFSVTGLEARLRRPGEPWLGGLRTYPVAVAGLVVLLPPAEAAVGWAVFAFGDAAASVVGRRVPAPALFGHRKATWSGSLAFLAVGVATGAAFGAVVAATGGGPAPSLARTALAALAAVLADLVPVPPDDNLPHALAAGLVLGLAPL